MKKSLLLCFAFITALNLVAQKQVLDLKTAVLEQGRKLRPERLSGLQWLPESQKFIYRDKNAYLAGTNISSVQAIIDKTQLNAMLKKSEFFMDTLAYLPSLNWINETSFWFIYADRLVLNVNVKSGSVDLIAKLDDSAEHTELNDQLKGVAYTQGKNLIVTTKDGMEVLSGSLFEKESTFGQSVSRNEFGINDGIFWSNNGQKLAFYKKDEGNVTNYPLPDYDKVPASTETIKYPMAGQGSEQVSVGIYHLEDKNLIFVEVEGKTDQYLTNLAWSPNDELVYIAVLNRDQNHLKLQAFDAATGLFKRTLFEEKDEKYVQPLQPMLFLPNNSNQFLWRSERSGFEQFYLYDIDGKLIKAFSSSISDFVADEIVGFSADGKSVFCTAYHNSGMDKDLFKADLKKCQWTKITNGGIHYPSYNKVSGQIIDIYTSAKEPLVQQIIDENGKVLQTLNSAKNPMDDYNIGKIEIGQITAADNITKLNYRLIYPADFDTKKKYPALVYVYNGPNVQLITNSHLNGASTWMFEMANRGFLVFTVDGRGSENRGKAFEQVIFRNLGEIERMDQLKGVEFLKSMPFVDSERLAVHGWSYGGFMTTNLMLNSPETFKVGVAGGPVMDWKYYEVMYGERYMDTPETNADGYEKAALTNKAKNLKGDLLIIHGLSDDVVVPQHSFDFLQSAVEAGVQVDFFPYVGHKHNVYGKDRLHLMEKVLNYVERNL